MVYIVLLWMMMSEDASTKLWVRGTVGISSRGEVGDEYLWRVKLGVKYYILKMFDRV